MDLLQAVVDVLRVPDALPQKNRDHSLTGNYTGCHECHIQPDWILIYRQTDTELYLVATGTHSDLFGLWDGRLWFARYARAKWSPAQQPCCSSSSGRAADMLSDNADFQVDFLCFLTGSCLGFFVLQYAEKPKRHADPFWNEPQKLDKKRIKRPQRSEFCIAQDSGRLVLI